MASYSIKEIAELAETSPATVSRVLSGFPGVRSHLRERVMVVVHKTGFSVNAAASALSRRTASAPGLVHNRVAVTLTPCVHETKLPYIAQSIYDGIFDVAKNMGIGTTIWHLDDAEMANGSAPLWMTRAPVDGVLAFSPSSADIAVLRKCGPLVAMAGQLPVMSRSIPVVEQDDHAGTRALLEYLHELGHRRFELAPFDLAQRPCRQRAEAFTATLAHLRAEGRVAESIRDKIASYAAAFAQRPPDRRPTALMVTSDGPAMELLRHLAALGVRVPRDVSVVGFDGYPWGQDASPPLTSWRPDWPTLGRLALRTLLDALAGRAPAIRTLIGGALIERTSADRPPRHSCVGPARSDAATEGPCE